jgi:hypothetical protein
MPGPDPRRLALVTWTVQAGAGQDASAGETRVGTGYFVTASLVLTAVPDDFDTPVSIRVEEGEPRWRENGRVKWRDATLDAALIQVSPPLPTDIVAVTWSEDLPAQNVLWNSTGYPEASLVDAEMRQAERKSAGLQGTLYVSGGGGQGRKELDLGVADPPAMKDWAGASGAPVFVGDALVGLVKSTGFDGRRFHGTPAMSLRQNVGFRLETEPAWLEYPRSGPWLLALVSETGSEEDFLVAIKGSLERHEELIAKAMDEPLHTDRILPVRLNEALQTPVRWLQFVQALCVAPLMIADVTGFEPGIMLALGVRAVVRRGVTLASTSNSLDDAEFVALPFNIQEAKLISHGDSDSSITDEDPRYSLNIIARTLLSGIRELKSNPRYLDLPAYDAVRCPAPELPLDQQRAREAVLVLCSFHEEYAPHWHKLLFALARQYPMKRTVRMRDVVSPRLVGQALYEQIRWTTTCVVDWSHWRSNVFFELGVRLACSKIEPVCLLEASDATPQLAQMTKLSLLLGPTRYALADVRPALQQALKVHEQHKALNDGDEIPPRAETRIPFNGTYQASLAAFEFTQERVTMPHDLLRFSNEAMLGKDRQRTGETPVLFSANPKFNAALSRSARERWIAAWLYLCNRYPGSELRSNKLLAREIRQLGETLLQEVRDDQGEAFISELRGQVLDLIDSLDDEEAELGKS